MVHPNADEGSMHNYRQSIISNKSLLKNAVAVGLTAFIQSRPFSLKGWNPSGFPGKNISESENDASSYMSRKSQRKGENLQRLGDKV